MAGSHRDFSLPYWQNNQGMANLESRGYPVASYSNMSLGDAWDPQRPSAYASFAHYEMTFLYLLSTNGTIHWDIEHKIWDIMCYFRTIKDLISLCLK